MSLFYSTIGMLIVFGLSFFSGCGEKNINLSNTKKGEHPGVLSVWPSWVKDKESKFDMHLNLANESDKDSIIIYLYDIQCYRGELRGTVKHTFFNTGERTIDLRPGEHKHFNAFCNLNTSGTGSYKIVVRRVYSNPGDDGKTRGDILAKDVEWTSKE